MNNTITAVPSIRVGHAQNEEALTGCTVILCEAGAVGGVDQRGGAPGTRETDLLRPLHRVEQVHGVLLTGGSAFGLDATGGVMRYLEERGVGFDVGVARVPIVPAAVIFDLAIGRADVRPDAAIAYQACLNATSDPVAEGNVGAGSGATVGKILGMQYAMKSGVGSACVEIAAGLFVGAIAVVNALGDVLDPRTGTIIAGARSENGFADTLRVMQNFQALTSASTGNTIIGVVATNAKLTKEEANKVAQMAHDGLARAVRPAHTMYDGDTIFALSTGDVPADVNLIGALAAEMFAEAIMHGVSEAKSVAGAPGLGR
ncbi:MAG TPA: P1 family peptidase [Anaerolineae bacterium]|nr:P1 family peptidase [Anaerolineae bacterium]